MLRNNFKDYLPIFLMLLIFLIDLSLIFSTHRNWNISMQKILPIKSQIQTLKSEVTVAHLWFEEAIGGDSSISIEQDVMKKLRIEKFKSFLKEEFTKKNKNEDVYIFNTLKEVESLIDEFYILAQDRWNDSVIGSIGSTLDQNFDLKFKGIIFLLDELNFFMDKRLDEEIEEKEKYFSYIITLFLLVNIIVFLLLYRYKTQKLLYEKKLSKNEKLLSQQSKMAAMGEMLENIAHQWRQPLSVISVSASGLKLKTQMQDLKQKELMQSLDTITDASKYLSNTIEDFKNYFSPQKDKNDFDIRVLYDKTFSLLKTKLEEEKIELIKNIDTFNLYSYENELLQVLVNIVNNAIDAFYKKEIKHKLIFIDIYIKEKYIYIDILDNAFGIDEEIISRVFEPYFTTKHKSRGTGIGLYMSKQIVEKHLNGEISVENKDFIYDKIHQKGAFFQIKLPIEARM